MAKNKKKWKPLLCKNCNEILHVIQNTQTDCYRCGNKVDRLDYYEFDDELKFDRSEYWRSGLKTLWKSVITDTLYHVNSNQLDEFIKNSHNGGKVKGSFQFNKHGEYVSISLITTKVQKAVGMF